MVSAFCKTYFMRIFLISEETHEDPHKYCSTHHKVYIRLRIFMLISYLHLLPLPALKN